MHSQQDRPGFFSFENWSLEFVWVFRLLRFDYFRPLLTPPSRLWRRRGAPTRRPTPDLSRAPQHGTVCKHEPHSYARSAMLDARLVTPRPRDVDGWILPTRTEGRGKEAARGLLKVHALAREQVSSLGMHISRRGSHLHGRIPDLRSREMFPP